MLAHTQTVVLSLFRFLLPTGGLLSVAVSAALFSPNCAVQADEPLDRVVFRSKSEVTGLAFDPDGTRLISTSLRDDRISVIVASDGSSESIGDAVGTVTGERSHAVAVSPDGTRVAIAGFRATAVFDCETLQEQWRMSTTAEHYSPPYVMALAFSPDGRQLATSGSSSKVGGPHGYKGGLIRIRDADSGDELHRYDDLSHTSDSIAFSPDGNFFAAGTYGAGGELPEPGELRIWNAKHGSLLHVWRAKDSIRPGEDNCALSGIAFSPDSHTIAIAGSDGIVRLWDVATHQTVSEFKGHQRGIRRVAFHPDGHVLASAGRDHTVRLWDVNTGQQLKSHPFDFPKINVLSFSPDSSLLIAGGGDFLRSGEVRMWNVRNLVQK